MEVAPGQHWGLFALPHLTSRDSSFVSSAARATRDGLFRAACTIRFTLTGSVFSALLSLSFLSLVSFCCKCCSYNIDETKSDLRIAGHHCRETRSLWRFFFFLKYKSTMTISRWTAISMHSYTCTVY